MAKDLFLGVGIGVVGAAAFKAAVGGSIRRVDQLGDEISNLQTRSRRIQAVRDLVPQLGRTAAAAHAARQRATQLGRALSEAAQPTRKLRREFDAARAEARRLTATLTAQRRQMQDYRTAMRQAGDGVRSLTQHERDLAGAIAERAELQARVAGRDQARQARDQARIGLAEAAAVGYAVARPLTGAVGAAVRFESVMADVRKVVDFPTPESRCLRLAGRSVVGTARPCHGNKDGRP